MQLAMLALDALREIGLFGGLSDEALVTFSGALEGVSVEAGEDVVREGEPGYAFFVVLDGSFEERKLTQDGVERRVSLLGAGEWFGEMSVLDLMPRASSVRAVTSGSLLKVSARDLDALYRRDVKAYALVVLNLARELSRRLRRCSST